MPNNNYRQWIVVRFEPTDRALIVKVAKSQRQDVSGFVRKCVLAEVARLGFLPDDQKRALGVT
jgi:uncharacterized protein (DUF1778 family)